MPESEAKMAMDLLVPDPPLSAPNHNLPFLKSLFKSQLVRIATPISVHLSNGSQSLNLLFVF